MSGRSLLVGAAGGAVLGAAAVGAWWNLSSDPSRDPAAAAPAPAGPDLRPEVERLRRELDEARGRAAARPEVADVTAAAPAPARTSRAEKTTAGAEALPQERLDRDANQEEAHRAERVRRAEVLLRNGPMVLLDGLGEKWAAPWDLLESTEVYGRLFERRTSGPTVPGGDVLPALPLEDGSEVEFPAGRWSLDYRRLSDRREFPADLLITGQGMDATLIVLSTEHIKPSELRGLTFRDLTIMNHGPLLDSGGARFTLRLERCRVLGFDCGAGGSVMLNGAIGAFHAIQCRFEVGYGKTPAGYSHLFRVRRAFLASMEDCVFRGPFTSFYEEGRGAYRFSRCHFVEQRPDRRGHLEKPEAAARFVECSFEFVPEGHIFPTVPRALTDFNPDWAEKPK